MDFKVKKKFIFDRVLQPGEVPKYGFEHQGCLYIWSYIAHPVQ